MERDPVHFKSRVGTWEINDLAFKGGPCSLEYQAVMTIWQGIGNTTNFFFIFYLPLFPPSLPFSLILPGPPSALFSFPPSPVFIFLPSFFAFSFLLSFFPSPLWIKHTFYLLNNSIWPNNSSSSEPKNLPFECKMSIPTRLLVRSFYWASLVFAAAQGIGIHMCNWPNLREFERESLPLLIT